MAHDLNFKEVTEIFKVGSTDVFVHKRKKSYQTLSTSKIPTISLWRDPLPGSHISLKTLKGVSSQRQLTKHGGLIDFWPDLAHLFGRFGRTKRWDGRQDFAQGRWWGGILWDVIFFCIKTASGRALLFSFSVFLLHAKTWPVSVEGMLQFGFHSLKHPCSLKPPQTSLSQSVHN